MDVDTLIFCRFLVRQERETMLKETLRASPPTSPKRAIIADYLRRLDDLEKQVDADIRAAQADG